MREAAAWAAVTVALAVGFGALLAAFAGGTVAHQFYAGWLTEYSLSLDNLLVFALLINSSRAPRHAHGRVLLLGIGLALLFRGVFIAAGAAALQRFGWLQYVFGVFLLGAAVWMARQRGGTGADTHLRTARWVARSRPPDGASRARARRLQASPLLILVVAIGVTDVMFALDSIPAVFGLTRDPLVVFTANLFALIGLRHLYFLVGGLLNRLAHLSAGVAAVLAYIGIKFVAEALRSGGVDNLGPVPVPTFSASVSLAVIVGLMAVAAVASLLTRAPRPEPAAAGPAGGDASAAGTAGGADTGGDRREAGRFEDGCYCRTAERAAPGNRPSSTLNGRN